VKFVCPLTYSFSSPVRWRSPSCPWSPGQKIQLHLWSRFWWVTCKWRVHPRTWSHTRTGSKTCYYR